MGQQIRSRVPTYNEGQAFEAQFRFFDSNFVASSPTTLRYRIDCLTSKRVIRDWTVVSPSQTVEITVTPEDNAIQSTHNVSERKQMVVQSNYGTSTQSVQKKDWVIENLQGVN